MGMVGVGAFIRLRDFKDIDMKRSERSRTFPGERRGAGGLGIRDASRSIYLKR